MLQKEIDYNMFRKSIYLNHLFLFAFSLALFSCGSQKPVIRVLEEKENLSEISEMDYFAPFFQFNSRDIPSSVILSHVDYSNKIVDSILNSHSKYRIADKIGNNTNLALVQEMSTLFEQFRKGEAPMKIPPLIRGELEQQHNRYSLALYFEPEFVFWRNGPYLPLSKPASGLVFNNTTVHALIFDKVNSRILFYRHTKGDRMKHYVWSLKGCFENLYKEMFPDFEEG